MQHVKVSPLLSCSDNKNQLMARVPFLNEVYSTRLSGEIQLVTHGYIYIYIILNITLMMWLTHTIIPIKMVFFYVFQSTIKKSIRTFLEHGWIILEISLFFVVYIKPLGQKLQVPKSGLHRSHSVGTVTGKLRMCCWGFLWGEATHLLQGMKLRGKVPKRQGYLCSKLESITTSFPWN